jgi:hypothetical protein|tara:strand:- start:78820 stop:78945 length:126 start_codon:yes stop_codon:yes gene_type:complete
MSVKTCNRSGKWGDTADMAFIKPLKYGKLGAVLAMIANVSA